MLGAAAIAAACSRPAPPPPAPIDTSPFAWSLPPGVPAPRVPADNPMATAKVDLGRRLFYDNRLSGTGRYACASCHRQELAFTEGPAPAVGATHAEHPRRAMGLANGAHTVPLGWKDGSLGSLEAQAAVPMFNEHPIELGLKGREAEVVSRFQTNDDMRRFAAAFAGDSSVTLDHIVNAIATFERTLISGDSPFDRYLYRDDRTAISDAARRGMELFFSKRLKCSECHAGFNLSGPVQAEGSAPGVPMFHHTGVDRFRAPTLRNIAVTAPYMHDGRLATLEAVVAHYASGGEASPLKSDRLRGFRITKDETADLVEFLRALTDRAFLTNPRFAKPD